MVQTVKHLAAMREDLGLIPGSGRSPGEGKGNPLQCSLPGESHEQRRLVGYSPYSQEESDTTEVIQCAHTQEL